VSLSRRVGDNIPLNVMVCVAMSATIESPAGEGVVVADPIPFADFVGALRAQLKLARGARDPDLPIEVGPVTVEFTLLTRQEGEGRAGIKFWVVDAGVSGKVGRESTQKVTMQLTPLDAAGGPLRVRDEEQQRQQSDHASPAAGSRGDVEPR
jgi:Trypsin-co-occurring domain 2